MDDPLPSGRRQDAPGVQVHQRLMWRRFTGPAVRVKTIEPGCKFSSGAPGKSAGSSDPLADARLGILSTPPMEGKDQEEGDH
jgi:hypothetical protein